MATPAFLVAELRTDTGETIATLPISQKQFKTGSRGYYTNHKVEIGGRRYQIQIQFVEIGSKNIAGAEPETKNG